MKRKLKSTIIATIFTASIMGAFLLGKTNTPQPQTQKTVNLYPLTTTVYELDIQSDVVTVEDYNGNLWSFEGTEDWGMGDCCSLLMDDNGTENIYDDIIVSARYSGSYAKIN